MAYSDPDDLLTGTMTVAPDTAEKFTNMAASDMDAELGVRFQLPLETDAGSQELPTQIAAYLAKCNRLIASGRLILSRHGSVEDNLHMYGRSLLEEGNMMLADMVSGAMPMRDIKLVGPQADGDFGGNAPTLVQYDAESGVDAYYGWLNEPVGAMPSTPGDPWWRPGPAS